MAIDARADYSITLDNNLVTLGILVVGAVSAVVFYVLYLWVTSPKYERQHHLRRWRRILTGT